MKKTLLIAMTVAGVLTVAASASAGSPRGDAMAASLRRVPGITPAAVARPALLGSPKGIAMAESLRRVSSTGPSLDLAHATRPTMSPKDSRYETALRANAAKQLEVQIAPLK